jgi:hypothetical protein
MFFVGPKTKIMSLLGEEVQQEKLVRPTTLALQMNNNVFEEKDDDDEQIERMLAILGDELKSVFATAIINTIRTMGKQICNQCVFDGHPMYAVPSTFPYFIGLDNQHFWCKIDNNKRKFDALFAAAYAVVDRADVVAHWLSQVELHFTETLGLSSILNFAADYMEHIESCCLMCIKEVVVFQLNAFE